MKYPDDMGSVGGGTNGGLGGGILSINATKHIYNNGRISSNGQAGRSWKGAGGSGGSLTIDTYRLEGFGTIEVHGVYPKSFLFIFNVYFLGTRW